LHRKASVANHEGIFIIFKEHVAAFCAKALAALFGKRMHLAVSSMAYDLQHIHTLNHPRRSEDQNCGKT
jgi:hypothetical protein